MSLLEARDLTVSATLGGQPVPVLRAVSFALETGKVLGLVGESGAGKSMLGRAVAQMLPQGFSVTNGSLRFDGEDLVTMAGARRRGLLGRAIAFIPQAPLTALNPVLTIGAQFDEHLARLGTRGRAERRARAVAMLEAAHLPNAERLLVNYPHQLSGGMCQRVLIAMAFASDPRLVVADEPTTALDVTFQPRIVRLIAEMRRQHGTALIFITHDLRLAAQLCDDVMVLYAGRAVEYGPARAVLANPAHPYTRCLQLANPSMSEKRHALYLLPEQMPSLRQLRDMPGCAFAARCPIAIPECRRAEPPSTTVAHGHLTACIRTDRMGEIAAQSVPTVTAASGRTLLDVQQLAKRYALAGRWFGGGGEIVAVRDASFAVAENEFVALVGESGSGKSTIAKLLIGLERPDAGRILLNGQDIADDTSEAHALRTASVQMVFQDPQSALNPRRRIASIVTQAMEAGSRHASFEERRARTQVLLAEMGLPLDCAERFPAQLSGGQRQRVNIARALCTVPKVLIADEIVSGLDVSIQAQLLALLARLRAELGFAMLFISHDLSVVRHLCSRVLVMYRGELVEQGPTETVFGDPQHPHTRALLSSVPPDASDARWAASRVETTGV